MGYFLRPASTGMLFFYNYHRCQWKVLSWRASAGAMQPNGQGLCHLNKVKSSMGISWALLTTLEETEQGFSRLRQIYFKGLSYINIHAVTCPNFATVSCSGTNKCSQFDPIINCHINFFSLNCCSQYLSPWLTLRRTIETSEVVTDFCGFALRIIQFSVCRITEKENFLIKSAVEDLLAL